MNDHAVEEIEHAGLHVKIYYDEDPMDPREWDNLGRMFCFHPRYDLGDKHDLSIHMFEDMGWDEILAWTKEEEGAEVFLPLHLLDHSGLSISTSDFNDTWDSGVVGFICDTAETRKLMGFELDRFGRDVDARAHILEVLMGEVKTYDQYLQGDIYGFVVEDEDGDTLDSCWGFFGTEDALNEGKAMAEWHAKDIAAERAQENARAIARTATLAWNGEEIDIGHE